MKKTSPLEIAQKVLAHEADAIRTAQNFLDNSFTSAVELIGKISDSGRLVATGLGKAGIIAQKISATLASTGQPSYFLHPSDAMHGDLGRFSREDIVLVLSKSGTTEEIVKLIPFVKRIGCKIIAMTGGTDSPLAKYSDIVLPIGTITEAGDHAIAPTASTTVMLALGDALALAVQADKDLSKQDFAEHHPGGAIGKALLTVGELMRSGSENCIVSSDVIVRDALKAITTTPGRPGAAAIVDKSGKLVGVFTDGNLSRGLAEHENILEMNISDLMGKTPKTITADKLAEEALQKMTQHKIDQLIVVDNDNKPIGLIDIQDLTVTR